jgi:hypothetical protein
MPFRRPDNDWPEWLTWLLGAGGVLVLGVITKGAIEWWLRVHSIASCVICSSARSTA